MNYRQSMNRSRAEGDAPTDPSPTSKEALSIAREHLPLVEFDVVLEKNPDTDVWIAEAPGVPGCYTQGASRQEALDNIREVLTLLKETEGLAAPPHVEFAKVRVEA